MKVLLFGSLADAIGKSVVETEHAEDVDTLKRRLNKDFPVLLTKTFQVAINKTKAETNVLLNDGDEIALLPPFAGG